jgi:hypothetical protein
MVTGGGLRLQKWAIAIPYCCSFGIRLFLAAVSIALGLDGGVMLPGHIDVRLRRAQE